MYLWSQQEAKAECDTAVLSTMDTIRVLWIFYLLKHLSRELTVLSQLIKSLDGNLRTLLQKEADPLPFMSALSCKPWAMATPPSPSPYHPFASSLVYHSPVAAGL